MRKLIKIYSLIPIAMLLVDHTSELENQTQEKPEIVISSSPSPQATKEPVRDPIKTSPTIKPEVKSTEKKIKPEPKPSESSKPVKEKELSAAKWIKPVDGKIANPFGNSYMFYDYYRSGHTGIDIVAKIGTKVISVDDGIVRFIKTKHNMRYGNYLVLEHKNKLYTLYGHLYRITVKEGQTVKKGDQIGSVGVSGLASFPHLHFEVTDRMPLNDGAWGYNYICKKRREKEIQKRDTIKNIPKTDYLTIDEIDKNFAFKNQTEKKMTLIYRMINRQCVEKEIKDLVYYNPEEFLPPFERVALPKFKYTPRPKVSPSPTPKPSSSPYQNAKGKVENPKDVKTKTVN